MNPTFDTEEERKLREILEEFPDAASRVLPALNFAQEVFGAITPDVEAFMADRLEIPLSRLHEVITFYHMYRKHPHGRYTLTVCDNLSCQLLGSKDLLAFLEKKLGIGPGESTEDGLFTIETAECLGACHQAPAFQVNGYFYGPLDLEEVDELIDRLREGGEGI